LSRSLNASIAACSSGVARPAVSSITETRYCISDHLLPQHQAETPRGSPGCPIAGVGLDGHRGGTRQAAGLEAGEPLSSFDNVIITPARGPLLRRGRSARSA